MMSECSKAQNLFSERIFAELLSDFHAFFFFWWVGVTSASAPVSAIFYESE